MHSFPARAGPRRHQTQLWSKGAPCNGINTLTDLRGLQENRDVKVMLKCQSISWNQVPFVVMPHYSWC